MTRRSALYRGSVLHARRDIHAQRTFRYPVYVAALDLDELPALDRELALFSHRGRNLYSLDDADYEGGTHGVAAAHHALLAEHGLAPPAATRLVTNLRVAGYVFNPVSFFIGYAATGAMTSVVAEVANTYGGRHRYVFGPAQRIGARGARVGFRLPRTLFVSPFLHGDASYELWLDAPLDGDALAITMHVAMHDAPPDVTDGPDPGDRGGARDAASQRTLASGARVLVAHLAGARHALTDRSLAGLALRFPLMTAQVIGLIHYQALKLRLAGVPYRRPGADHRPIRTPTNVVSRAPRPASMK